MNEKEMAIIGILKKNPFVSQQEMAEMLHMSRPAVANILSSLTRQGIIRGRAYVLAEDEIICIGGANVDRKFHLSESAQLETSNPASVEVSVGGVARNIAENLGRLGQRVRLLSIAGADADWKLIEHDSAAYMDVSTVELLSTVATGSYSAVLNPDGELVIALANMDVYNYLTPQHIESHERLLKHAKLIVMDLNCPKETVAYVKQWAIQHDKKLAIVPVSSPKMDRMPKDLHGVTWFICNADEAERYTNKKIESLDDWKEAVKVIQYVGAENVAITAGKKGIMAADDSGEVRHYEALEQVQIEDVTGAGDAFVSGVLFGYLSCSTLEQAIDFGRINAAKTVESVSTVRPELSQQRLLEEMEDIK